MAEVEVKEASDGRQNMDWSKVQLQGAKWLLDKAVHFDLTISCGNKEWYVHKTQLCIHSEYFRTLFHSEFKETYDNLVALDDDHPDAVGAMLEYFYTGKYSDPPDSEDGPSPLVFDTYLYILADKYFVPHLQALAAENFKEQCNGQWKLSSFADAIALIYDHGPELSVIKEKAVDVARSHLKELYAAKAKYKAFHDVLLATPSFAVDLLTVVIDPPAKEGVKIAKTGETAVEIAFKCPYDGLTFKTSVSIGLRASIECAKGHKGSFKWWKPHQTSIPVPDNYEVTLKCPEWDCGRVYETRASLGEALRTLCSGCQNSCTIKDMVVTQ